MKILYYSWKGTAGEYQALCEYWDAAKQNIRKLLQDIAALDKFNRENK